MDINVNFGEFDDSDDEIFLYLNNLRPYNVRKKPDNFNKWSDDEFYKRFRLSKVTVERILRNIEHLLVFRTHR